MSLPNYMGWLTQFYKSIIILYENVFQNPELFRTQVSLSTEQSPLTPKQISEGPKKPAHDGTLIIFDEIRTWLKISFLHLQNSIFTKYV
jgi:hypothetical protein